MPSCAAPAELYGRLRRPADWLDLTCRPAPCPQLLPRPCWLASRSAPAAPAPPRHATPAPQEERLKVYKAFKEGTKRILVATDLVGRGIDIERVNIVINYDMPETDEVGRRHLDRIA